MTSDGPSRIVDAFDAAQPTEAPPIEQAAASPKRRRRSSRASSPGADAGRDGVPPHTPHGSALDRECARFPLTDLGNTERFVRRNGQEFLWCPAIGWLVWDGRRYALDPAEGKLSRAVHETIRAIEREAEAIRGTDLDYEIEAPRPGQPGSFSGLIRAWAKTSQGAAHVSCIIRLAEPYFEVATSELDADPFKINLLNGTLVVARQTGDTDVIVLKPHDRRDRITKLAPIEYRPDVGCPLYDAFLNEVQPEPATQRFLHQWGGLGLTGDASNQKFCVWYGRGRNGKGTTLDIWGYIAGDYCGSVSIETFLEQSRSRRGGDATPDLAKLPGVRMLRTSEPDRGARLAEALIKLVTGGDPIDARHLNREFFSFIPQFKLTMSGNHQPQIIGGDEGIWARVLKVPWPIIVPAERRDPRLGDKLRAEASGILNRLLDGLRDYVDNGLVIPESVAAATAEYRADSDPAGRFMEACTQTDPGGRVQSSMLYELYVAWATSAGEKPWSQRGFSDALVDRGYRKKHSDVNWWLDIKLTKNRNDFVDFEGKPLMSRAFESQEETEDENHH
jgi:putative DNA primase/helicase